MQVPGSSDNNSQISDLYDQFNRQADQLDSFNDKLSFVTNGSLTVNSPGTAATTTTAQFQHGLGYAPIYMTYYKLQADTKWRNCNDITLDATGSVVLELTSFSDTTYLYASVTSIPATSAQTVSFRYYLLREPAQQT